MKKFLPIFLSLIICFSLLPSFDVSASYTDGYFVNINNNPYTLGYSSNGIPVTVSYRHGSIDAYCYYASIGSNYYVFFTRSTSLPRFDFTFAKGGGSSGSSYYYKNFYISYIFFGNDISYSLNCPFLGVFYSLDMEYIGSLIDSFEPFIPPTSEEIGFLKNLKYSYNGSEVVFSWDELTSNDFGYDGVEVNDLSILGGLKTKFTGKSSGVQDIGYTQQYITQFPTRNTLGQLINSINAWLTNQDIADNYTQLAHSYNFYYFRPYIVEGGQKYYGQWISAYYDSDAGRVEVTNNPDLNEPMTNVINNRSVRYIYSDEYYTIEGDEVVNNYDYSTTINNTYNYYTTNNYYYDSDEVSGIDLSSVLKFITDIFNFFYKLVDFIFIPLSWLPSEIISLCKAILVGAIIVLIYKVINPFK